MELDIVASILNIKSEDLASVEITDRTDTGLVMVHHKQFVNITKYGWIRGIVIDLNLKEIICPAYGPDTTYVSTVVSDSLISTRTGTLELIDDQLNHLTIDLSSVRIEQGYEGTIIRVFCHKGVTYWATHRRFNSKTSRWVVSRSFYDLYVDLGGPEQIFTSDPEEYEHGLNREVYYFLVAHQEVQSVSQAVKDKGRLIFLGTKRSTISSKSFEDDFAKRFPRPDRLTVDQANSILLGNLKYNDIRFRQGDFVIITASNMMVKIVSRSYKWRQDMRDDNPYIRHLWFKYVSDSYIDGRYTMTDEDFLKKYPLMNIVQLTDLEAMIEHDFTFNVEPYNGNPNAVTKSSGARMHMILQTLLLVLPPKGKVDLLNYYREFFEIRKNIIQWLYKLYRNNEDLSKFEPDPQDTQNQGRRQNRINRIKQIINDVTSFAERRLKEPGLNKRKMNKDQLVFENISNLIQKELGTSLYRIYKQMELITNVTPAN